MDGNIFNTTGRHVGSVSGAAIFDLAGKKLYELKGTNIYRLSGRSQRAPCRGPRARLGREERG
jgi:hypothetical protein